MIKIKYYKQNYLRMNVFRTFRGLRRHIVILHFVFKMARNKIQKISLLKKKYFYRKKKPRSHNFYFNFLIVTNTSKKIYFKNKCKLLLTKKKKRFLLYIYIYLIWPRKVIVFNVLYPVFIILYWKRVCWPQNSTVFEINSRK